MPLPDSPQHLRIIQGLAKFFEGIDPRFYRLVRVHKRITTKAGVPSTGIPTFFPIKTGKSYPTAAPFVSAADNRPPWRRASAQHASRGGLFQPRCRTVGDPCRSGLGQPRQTWSRTERGPLRSGGSESPPRPRSCSRRPQGHRAARDHPGRPLFVPRRGLMLPCWPRPARRSTAPA